MDCRRTPQAAVGILFERFISLVLLPSTNCIAATHQTAFDRISIGLS
ncbi:MAG TPA: hypothetical protein VF019_04715 [Nitrospira sp.]